MSIGAYGVEGRERMQNHELRATGLPILLQLKPKHCANATQPERNDTSSRARGDREGKRFEDDAVEEEIRGETHLHSARPGDRTSFIPDTPTTTMLRTGSRTVLRITSHPNWGTLRTRSDRNHQGR